MGYTITELTEKIMEHIETELTEENKLKLKMLMEAGVIAYIEGEWYIASCIDPYREKPVGEEEVIEYLNYNHSRG